MINKNVSRNELKAINKLCDNKNIHADNVILRKNKKAQEEVMGFVIIILMVVIIGVVFFAFSLRKPVESTEQKQAELDDMINSMLLYTTECKLNNENQTIKDLIKECSRSPSTLCSSSENVCIKLNSTLKNMYSKLLGTGITNGYVHGYVLNITNSKQIVYLSEGNMTGSYFASSIPINTVSGDVIVKLRFYYSKA